MAKTMRKYVHRSELEVKGEVKKKLNAFKGEIMDRLDEFMTQVRSRVQK